MAGTIWVANSTAELALASSSEACVVQIIPPSSVCVKIKEWGVFFDGVSATASPVLVRVVTGNSGPGLTYTSHTPARRSGPQLASQCTVRTNGTSSASGSPFAISGTLAVREVHPQSGYQEKFSYGDEPLSLNPTTGVIVSLLVNSPTTVNVVGEIVYEE